MFCFLINIFACIWKVPDIFEINPDNNWEGYAGVAGQDETAIHLAALYWAITTCATVGYGDIIAKNDQELAICMGVIIVGVAAFSFALSNLTTQFVAFNRTVNLNEERKRAIKELDKKYKIDKQLLSKIKEYFQENQDKLNYTSNRDVAFLMRTMPSFLKTKLALFLYNEAIQAVKFLQGRDYAFYEGYLDKIKPFRAKKNEIILKEGTKSKEVCFIITGSVLNKQLNRVFSDGAIFGIEDVMYNRDRICTYIADTKCYLIKYDKETFLKILDEFPAIKTEIDDIAYSREKIRQNQDNIKNLLANDAAKDQIIMLLDQIRQEGEEKDDRNQQKNATKLKREIIDVLEFKMKAMLGLNNLDTENENEIENEDETATKKQGEEKISFNLEGQDEEGKIDFFDSQKLKEKQGEPQIPKTDESNKEEFKEEVKKPSQIGHLSKISQLLLLKRRKAIKIKQLDEIRFSEIQPSQSLKKKEQSKKVVEDYFQDDFELKIQEILLSDISLESNVSEVKLDLKNLKNSGSVASSQSIYTKPISNNQHYHSIQKYRREVQEQLTQIDQVKEKLKLHRQNAIEILKKEHIPEQLKNTLEHGNIGFMKYIRMIIELKKYLKENNELVKDMAQYSFKLSENFQLLQTLENDLDKIDEGLNGDQWVLYKIQRSRNEIKNNVDKMQLNQQMLKNSMDQRKNKYMHEFQLDESSPHKSISQQNTVGGVGTHRKISFKKNEGNDIKGAVPSIIKTQVSLPKRDKFAKINKQ